MKKFIYSLSIAIACGFAANATDTNMQAVKASSLSKDVQTAQLAPSTLHFDRISGEKREAKRKATSIQDFEGTYKWSGRNQLQGVVFPNEGVLTITATSDTKALIAGFDAMAEPGLEATFDAEKGRLYIPQQFTFLNGYYNDDVYFVNWTVKNGYDDEGNPGYLLTQAPAGYEYYFTLDGDGIKAGDIDPDKWDNHEYTDAELYDSCCIACNMMLTNDSGFFWMCFGVTGEPLEPFQYVEDQWQKLGDAEFTDAWFPIFWEQNPTYPVECYYDKSQEGRYMLLNPYGYGNDENNPYIYYGINIAPEKPGYLVFDINEPECVVFEPFVYGITLDMRVDEDDPVLPQEMYCFNAEGYYYYLQNASMDEIIINFEEQGSNVSYLNTRTNTVYIYNAVFTMGLNSTFYSWDNFDMEGYIVLPDNYMDGVDSVLGENADAPAVYYNLQGQRVNNPEKGQLLIVKKGNKAYKQIMR